MILAHGKVEWSSMRLVASCSDSIVGLCNSAATEKCRISNRRWNAPEFYLGDIYHNSRIDGHNPWREARGMQKRL